MLKRRAPSVSKNMSSGKPSPRMVGTVDSRGTGRVHLVVDHTVFFFLKLRWGFETELDLARSEAS